jgi:purine-binding chemotaxis protein CheW
VADTLVLVLRIAGERVAIRASDVESVIEVDEVTPVPRTAPHIAGLTSLRSRILTVIDCRAALGAAPAAAGEAVVVPADGHAYALLVDGVEDVVEPAGDPSPVTLPLAGGWSRAARFTVDVGGDLLLLVDPHRLIAGPDAKAAA